MSSPQSDKVKPVKRPRSEFVHYRTLLGMSRQEQADFCWADMRRYFKVTLWDRSRDCAACGKPIEAFDDASLDHIIPRSKGGRTRLVNVQLMHKRCNSKKSSQITTVLPHNKFMKAMTPADSNRGQLTRRQMGLSVNGRATPRG